MSAARLDHDGAHIPVITVFCIPFNFSNNTGPSSERRQLKSIDPDEISNMDTLHDASLTVKLRSVGGYGRVVSIGNRLYFKYGTVTQLTPAVLSGLVGSHAVFGECAIEEDGIEDIVQVARCYCCLAGVY